MAWLVRMRRAGQNASGWSECVGQNASMRCVIDASSIADPSRRGCRRHSYSYFTKSTPLFDLRLIPPITHQHFSRMGLLPRQRPSPLRHRPHRSHPYPSARLSTYPRRLIRVQISALFHRHVSKDRIDLIHRETSAGRGRSATLWTRLEDAKPAEADPYGA
jgi:hypothetical protein